MCCTYCNVTFSHTECVLWQNMVDEGYAATQILSQLHESVIEQDLSDRQKSAITEKMAVSDCGGAQWVHNRNIGNVIATPQLFESCTVMNDWIHISNHK